MLFGGLNISLDKKLKPATEQSLHDISLMVGNFDDF